MREACGVGGMAAATTLGFVAAALLPEWVAFGFAAAVIAVGVVAAAFPMPKPGPGCGPW